MLINRSENSHLVEEVFVSTKSLTLTLIVVGCIIGGIVLFNNFIAIGIFIVCLIYIMIRMIPQAIILIFWLAFTVQYLYEFTATHLQIGNSRLYLLDVIIILMSIRVFEIWTFKFINKKNLINYSVPMVCFTIFYLVGIYSLIRGIPQYGNYAFGEFRMILFSGLFFYIVLELNDAENIQMFIKIVTLSSLILPIYTIYNIITNANESEYFLMGRYISHPQALYALFALIAIWIFRDFIIKKYIWKLMYSFLLVFAIIASAARATWVAAAICLPLAIWFSEDNRKYFIGISFLLIFIILILIGQFDITQSSQFDKVKRTVINRYENLLEGGEGNTAKFRLDAWEQTINNRIRENLLLGSPMGSHYEIESGGIEYSLPSHNTYLDLASKTGLVGLVSFLILIAYYFLKSIKILRITKNEITQKTLFYLLLSAFALLIYLNFDSGFTIGGSACGILLWLFLAMIHRTINYEYLN